MNNLKVSIPTLLYRQAPALLALAAASGSVAGALYSWLIPFVLHALTRQTGANATLPTWIDEYRMTVFFAACLMTLVTKATSVMLVNNIAKAATGRLRLQIAEKINRMPVAAVEHLGFARLLTILSDDVNQVASAALSIPMLLVSAVTVIGMLAYLATLSLTVFAVVLASICIGIFAFQVPVGLATGLYERARMLRDVIQEGLRGLIFGVYELKLSPRKSRAFIDNELRQPIDQSVRLEKWGDTVFHLAGTSSDLLSFFVIGIVVFVLPEHMAFPQTRQTGVVMALLYIAGPVANILGILQHLRAGEVAIRRVRTLGDVEEEFLPASAVGALPNWGEYRIEAGCYQYPYQDQAQRETFSLGPVTLSFRRRQINFIVGGNGSGKSTLSKLLSLHYVPTEGALYFDDVQASPGNRQQLRDQIGVIFSNYYLFNKLYRPHSAADEAFVHAYLDALGLSGKTQFIDGQFTTTRLSDGQRRRLALLVALCEDKPIYIFDEWAADQDPGFKKIFYETILPDLKARNKLLIIITHDDRYFHCADRLIFMEEGRVAEIREQALAQPLPAGSNTVNPLVPTN